MQPGAGSCRVKLNKASEEYDIGTHLDFEFWYYKGVELRG